MSSILSRLDGATRAVFEDMGFPAAIAGTRESDRPDMAPFQCNGAMAAAGIAKKRGEKVNPRDIAARAVEKLSTHPAIEKLEIAGPGFINIHPKAEIISGRAAELADSETCGIEQQTPLTIVIDYGGANVAKPMHVGHLRSAVIGESIKRLLRAQGHTAVGAFY